MTLKLSTMRLTTTISPSVNATGGVAAALQCPEHPFPDAEAAGVGTALCTNRHQRHQHRDEAHPVQEKGERHAERGNEQPRDRRADDARPVHDHRVERDGVGEVRSADQVRDVRLTRGDVDGAPQPVDQCENRDVPVLDAATPDERRQHERLGAASRFG